MSIDPIGSIPLGSKFPKMVHGPIWPYYLHAPNLAVLHWRQQSAHRYKYDPLEQSGQVNAPIKKELTVMTREEDGAVKMGAACQ
jgi:hypothetical protein